ncbi:hypothetical protein A5658_04300 [Mycobacterium sp. 1245111.1]|uniref:hypothetical protein n=1 Tax=Mycobacterium sp. 1245111.1 TaxID=1834073 RepID=UPI0007FCDCD8|nr:hypothetical protein [Mycobacterium sp. 1245111.1]OBK37184.1 hypothetical protein A5658_04300 [Mycobacterium sp. 1245111.1]
MKIKVDGAYSDGHEFVNTEDVPEYTGDDFDDETDDSLQAFLFTYTGDGHGKNSPKLNCYCEITILEAANPALVGRSFGFG